MTAQERRNAILSHLQRGKSPLSATALAGLLGVSRQVIVGDVALLRAGGVQIVSTSRGYQALRRRAWCARWSASTPPIRPKRSSMPW